MTHQQWTAVDDYFTDQLALADQTLDAALAASAAAGLPAIQVSPPQGRLLQLLAGIHGARSILEIGTLGGYSTICLARGLAQGGHVTTLEIDPKHADVAAANFARAGLTDVIELRLGPAMDSLSALADEGAGPFDLIFIDADKPNNPGYFTWSLRLARPGTVIIVDNVVRNGSVIETSGRSDVVNGVRKVVEMIGGDPRVTATAIQTVGGKGYDGFILATVNHL
ncbi:MAG TPA: O-methyltransferase [Pseudonocardiaceae bacterium]|jgi:predicted O-methyltransferase YrrM|nr:O-methyltransferase [Pseudonocardiaceae bacterium]